jgi:hypothetical protein
MKKTHQEQDSIEKDSKGEYKGAVGRKQIAYHTVKSPFININITSTFRHPPLVILLIGGVARHQPDLRELRGRRQR